MTQPLSGITVIDLTNLLPGPLATLMMSEAGAQVIKIEKIDGGESLVPAWVMPLGKNAWLLRLHEVSGQRGTARLKLASGWKAERASLNGAKATKGDARKLSYTPYQIVTVKISRA